METFIRQPLVSGNQVGVQSVGYKIIPISTYTIQSYRILQLFMIILLYQATSFMFYKVYTTCFTLKLNF